MGMIERIQVPPEDRERLVGLVRDRNSARRPALFEKAGLVDHDDRIVICQMLDDIIVDDITQRIGIPISATQDRQPPQRAVDRVGRWE
jgi:hypothetical protein